MNRTQASSPYMRFAKLRSAAKYNLAASGIQGCSLSDFDFAVADEPLALHGPNVYGYEPLIECIAQYCGVPTTNVATALGTSGANYFAMAATFEPGDEILIEDPTYELLISTAEFLGARITRFPRRKENGFRVDADDVVKAITSKTRLVVLCNLHNPTSVGVDEDTLRAIGDAAAKVGARVLVDEVYLELIHPRPTTAAALGPQFITTSSLTKAYGLSGLRCGWVLAEPEIIERVWNLRDLAEGSDPFLMEQHSVIAFRQLDRFRQRAQRILDANRPLLIEVIKRHADVLECVVPEHGTTLAPRLRRGNMDEFAEWLREKYETSVVPGRYFLGMPEYMRVGAGGEVENTRVAIERLDTALTEWARR